MDFYRQWSNISREKNINEKASSPLSFNKLKPTKEHSPHCSTVKMISKTLPSHTNIKPQVVFVDNSQSISQFFETDKDIVEHYLEGVVLQNDTLALVKNLKMVVRHDHQLMKNKVKILSGGSAGYEPLHSGFVGEGMLTAAILGELSSSPPYLVILDALRLLSKHHTKGILVLVMNNMADRLNFGLACQQAAHEGVNVMCVTVGEDCSGIAVDKTIGRRSLAGIVFLQKIAGAMSEEGKTLQEIFSVLMALKGGSLGSVNVNITGDGVFFGNGMKGETGNLAYHQSVSAIVNEALFYIFNPASYFSLHNEKNDNVAIIVNNFGKISEMQLTLIVKEIFPQMTRLGLNIVRVYSGSFMSIKSNSLGFSISALKLGHDNNILKWLDIPTSATKWPGRTVDKPSTSVPFKDRCLIYIYNPDSFNSELDEVGLVHLEHKNLGPRFSVEYASTLVTILKTIVKTVIDMEDYLNQIDLDHDYGTNMKMFVRSLKKELDMRSLNILTPYGLFNSLAELAATTMGGVSGAVFSVMLSSAAQAFLTVSKFDKIKWEMWIAAARMARDGLTAYTRVQPGGRTIMDALHPFADAFNSPTFATLRCGVIAASLGAEDTKSMRGFHNHPDPGAHLLAVVLRDIFTQLETDLEQDNIEEEYKEGAEEDTTWYCESCERFLQQERGQEVWFCDSCWGSLTKVENTGELWYCDSCSRTTEEFNWS